MEIIYWITKEVQECTHLGVLFDQKGLFNEMAKFFMTKQQ